MADKYLLEHFYGTCCAESKARLACTGVEIDVYDREYSWLDVLLDGGKKCSKCEYISERQGFYYGKGQYSSEFSTQEYVSLDRIRNDEEFEAVCKNINKNLKGIVIGGAVSDASD